MRLPGGVGAANLITGMKQNIATIADGGGRGKPLWLAVARLKKVYVAWWNDIQAHLVNNRLKDVPETCKPCHHLYLRDFGRERYDEAMRLMAWQGSKPGIRKPDHAR